MARDVLIDARLCRWAQAVTVGDGSGFPTMSVLHREWQPPSGGMVPSMKVHPLSDVVTTHDAIRHLSMRLRNTVVVHYCLHLPLAEQAERLECAVDTVHGRVEQAHRELASILCAAQSVRSSATTTD